MMRINIPLTLVGGKPFFILQCRIKMRDKTYIELENKGLRSIENQTRTNPRLPLERHFQMTTYPIAIELTAWVELGLNQYEITIEKVSRITVKRTDDVLHSRELTAIEVDSILKAITGISVPIAEELVANSNPQAVSSYELIIESAHFSLEYNWEDVDAQASDAFDSVNSLAQLIEQIGHFE